MADKIIKQKAKNFYTDVLNHLVQTKIPFLIAGTFAFSHYTGIIRPTKDMDIFCKAGDYPRILNSLAEKGFKTEVLDERWLAKAHHKEHFMDIIFGVINGVWTIDDTWFEKAPTEKILDVEVKVLAPEEMIWSKIFRHSRSRSDMADVNHLILKLAPKLDWKHLLTRMEQQWEVLLSVLLIFRFIYPSDRDLVPSWLMEELIDRLQNQMKVPTSKEKVSRGQIFSASDYEIDFKEWGYQNLSRE